MVARDTLKGTTLDYGILLGSFGLGAIVGMMASGRLRARFYSEILVTFALAGFAIGIEWLAFSRNLPLSCLTLGITGGCWVMAPI